MSFKQSDWSIAAGGTGAYRQDTYSYSIRGDFGSYFIWPPSTRFGGYTLLFTNDKGRLKDGKGLWRTIGMFRSPQAAKSAAKKHFNLHFG